MINELIIRKLVDYILLNACSVSSSGLYNGKAGMALALFETARYLQDEYIEEQALNLLQEALLSKTDDIGFENGLSGIGYVLLYLIENDFIDADFEEIFGEKFKKIISCFENFINNPNFLLNAIKMNYFFSSVKSYSSQDQGKGIDQIIKSIFETNELYLINQFLNFKDINYINNKNKVLDRIETYLKVVYECNYTEYSYVVLQNYAEIYRNGRIISSYRIAYYLEKLDIEGKFIDIINDNKKYSESNIMERITLKNNIDLANIIGDDNLINVLTLKNRSEFEKLIFELIPHDAFKAGYEQGISRLIIYIVKYLDNYKIKFI
jgi:hypothetical protein